MLHIKIMIWYFFSGLFFALTNLTNRVSAGILDFKNSSVVGIEGKSGVA